MFHVLAEIFKFLRTLFGAGKEATHLLLEGGQELAICLRDGAEELGKMSELFVLESRFERQQQELTQADKLPLLTRIEKEKNLLALAEQMSPLKEWDNELPGFIQQQRSHLEQLEQQRYTTRQEHYESGALKFRLHYKDDRLDGKAESRHENGNLRYSCLFKQGRLMDTMVTWHADGTPYLEFSPEYEAGLYSFRICLPNGRWLPKIFVKPGSKVSLADKSTFLMKVIFSGQVRALVRTGKESPEYFDFTFPFELTHKA